MSVIPVPEVRVRVSRPVVVLAAVLAVDAASKAWLVTPGWGQHHRSSGWTAEAVLALAVPVGMLWYPRLRMAGALLLAGLLGNLVSALHGDVANPLMVQHGLTQVAFNVADVALLAGALAAVGVLPAVGRDAFRVMRSRGVGRRGPLGSGS